MERNGKIRSMTGYGRDCLLKDGISYEGEIGSVNNRYLDITVRLPGGWISLEERIKREIQPLVRRGRVDVFVQIRTDQLSRRNVTVNWEVAEAAIRAAREMKGRFALDGSLSVSDLFHVPEVVTVEEVPLDPESCSEPLREAVRTACIRLVEMRRKEGEALAEDLFSRTETLQNLLVEIRSRAPKVAEEYRRRLETRLKEWMEGVSLDENRLMMEAALYAERADISEELTRLDSHVSQFRRLLSSDEPVGRRLDFLLQEMNREINTIGSKANDGLISLWVVDCKSELEKMREQVQNIE